MAVLGFELKALHLLGNGPHAIFWTLSPAIFTFFFFFRQGLTFLSGSSLRLLPMLSA
jgi:hypothetical protein